MVGPRLWSFPCNECGKGEESEDGGYGDSEADNHHGKNGGK